MSYAIATGLAVILMLTSGCSSLLPTRKSDSSNVRAAETLASVQSFILDKVVAPAIKPEPVNSNYPVATKLHVESVANTSGIENISASDKSKVTIPMWINMIGFSIAILLLLFAVGLVRKYSKTADVIIDTADSGFASVIRSIRDRAITTDNHREMSLFNSIIASLESERGKLGKKK